LTKQKIAFDQLQAVYNERIRIASDMHDDLGSGLTTIKLLSEIINMKIGDGNIAKSESEKLVVSVSDLSESLREIIWTMNMKHDRLEDFIIHLRSYSVPYFDGTAITFHFNRPTVIPEIIMHGELRRNVFLCIKEALNNIIKHSGATEASLTFDIVGSKLITEIKDNGVGINVTSANRYGNGLSNMKARLNKFESDLEIEVNNGTKLVFRVTI